ncbi:helix-turn-helix transcriptional regulator [Candidatus Pacearchaeota archaeon]|nr:helix-turn-helix transcriptional regulator [Candidatus Pacearchaeota archaeon]
MINKNILHSCHKEGFDETELYGAYKIFFGTLVSEPRLKIINLLRKGRKNVGEVMQELKMNQTAVSHDLRRLKECGFVLSERDGKFVYYILNDKSLGPLMEIIESHMSKYCIHILRDMKGGKK